MLLEFDREISSAFANVALSMNYNLTSAPKLYMVAYLLDITAN
jgi:hypothetical protein